MTDRLGTRDLATREPAGSDSSASGLTGGTVAGFEPIGSGSPQGDDPFGLHLLGDDPSSGPATSAGAPAAPGTTGAGARVASPDQTVDERADEVRTKDEHDAWDVSALAYFDRNLNHILLLVRAQVAAATWTLGHPRLQWAADPAAVAAALTSRLVELAGGATADRMPAFLPFWHPIDLWTVIDNNRHLTGGTPGEYAKGQPTAKGPMRRDGAADAAVAVELVAALRPSLARMAPRFVATADAIHPLPVEVGQLVTSAPIDRLWARVLADPALVRYTAPTGAAGEAATPSGPGTFRGGPRPVTYEWMGSHDPRMWNVLRVISPTDATAEEVAAQLYQYPGIFSVQSHNAYAIVNAAPFFVLPRTWAKDFPDAVKWASVEHASAREEPIDAVLQSSAVDQAAIAQGADETAHPLAHKHKAGRADTERLTALLWRGSDQLAFVAEALAPWKLDEQISAERAWIQRRAMALVSESPAQVAMWAPVIEAQQRTITAAAAAALEIADAARAAGITPAQPKAGPFRRAIAAYAAALGTSHLADLARARMATADGERQQLALVALNDTLADATNATESLRETEGGRYDPMSDAGELTRQRRNIQRDKNRLRADALDGQVTDPAVIEDLTINAGMVAVRARAKDLGRKAAALSSMLTRTQDATLINAIAAAFDSSFESLPGKLEQLAYACQAVEQTMDHAGFDESIGWRPSSNAEDQAAQTRRLREVRRHALATAQADLAALPATYHLDRLQRDALDAVQTNQIAALAINVIILIAASAATSGLAAYAGGAVRGLAIVRLGMSAERATVIGGAVNVAVDSVLTAGVQAGLSGDDFTKATAENILANVGVRAALARFAPLMSALDDEAAAVWQSGTTAAKGGVVIAKGAAIGAELITAAGVSYVAQRLVRGQQPPSDDEMTAWFIQGASMAVGRMIATRTTQLHARLDRLGAHTGAGTVASHAQLLARVAAQASLARQVTDGGDPNQAMRLLAENRALLDESARLWRELEADPTRAAALGLSASDLATFTRDTATARADTAKQGMDVLPLRLAGVDELVPGALWRGSSEQIATALHQARAVGLAVHVDQVGNRQKEWHIRIGDSPRVLKIQETTPTAIAGQHVRRPRAAGVVPEARALLHAKAAAELKQIIPTEAPTRHASRGLLVTPAEGRRMAELLPDIEGAETIEYKAGMLVRIHDSNGGPLREWYFEFRDDAHAQADPGKRTAPSVGAAEDASGLPAPNVATVEIYAYSGAKEINGRPLSRMSPEERAEVEAAANANSALLLAGHVAVSFDGGKTLYGFTPDTDPKTSGIGREFDVADVVAMLRDRKTFPGKVANDTVHYELAYQFAVKHGWKIEVERVVVTFDPTELPALVQATFGEAAANKLGEHQHAYWFPPKGATTAPDSVAENGQPFSGACTANCATWIRFLGIPLPEPSGRMTEYVPRLKEWADADAPIAGRNHAEDAP